MQRHTALFICALIAGASLNTATVHAQDVPVTAAEVQALERRIAALENTKELQGSTEVEALKAELAALREKVLEEGNKTRAMKSMMDAQLDDESEEEEDSDIQVGGFVRAGYDLILENEKTNLDFIGLNDGFVLSDARINVGGSMKEIDYFVEVNASTARLESDNNTRGSITTQLTDAYLEYVPFRNIGFSEDDGHTEDDGEVAPDKVSSVLRLRLGHFRRPFDAESIKRANKLYFVERSLETRGVVGAEGRNVGGLGAPRELGFMAHGLYRHASKAGVYYAVYATNGNGGRSVFNDNDQLALGGRIEAKYDDMVSLGFAYALNPQTTGQAPDLIDEDTRGLTVDLQLDLYGVVADAALIRETRSFPDIASEPETTAQGYHFAVAYRAPLGITPSYRFAYLDPTSESTSNDPNLTTFNETDEVTHHTIGLIWDVPDRPVRILTNYTIALENDAQAVANDHLQFLGQMSF